MALQQLGYLNLHLPYYWNIDWKLRILVSKQFGVNLMFDTALQNTKVWL